MPVHQASSGCREHSKSCEHIAAHMNIMAFVHSDRSLEMCQRPEIETFYFKLTGTKLQLSFSSCLLNKQKHNDNSMIAESLRGRWGFSLPQPGGEEALSLSTGCRRAGMCRLSLGLREGEGLGASEQDSTTQIPWAPHRQFADKGHLLCGPGHTPLILRKALLSGHF